MKKMKSYFYTLITLLYALAIIAGCDARHGEDFSDGSASKLFDQQSGVRIEYDDNVKINITLREAVEIYESVESCTGLSAYGPKIYFVEYLGSVYIYGRTIQFPGFDPYIELKLGLSGAFLEYNLRHEYIHYLLRKNNAQNNHESPVFNCAVDHLYS